jgi:DNA-binding transcriptional MerR regulator
MTGVATIAAKRTALKVGELAKKTGVSVRTLHYYDQIGLLEPSQHTEVGHRLYAASEISRLQQIRSLQQLGLSLEEIRDLLSKPGVSLKEVIEMHIDRLKEQIELQQWICRKLEAIAYTLRSAEEPSTDDMMKVIEVMNKVEKHYTQEQLEWLKKRAETIGEPRIREVEAEWPVLIEQVRVEMEKGTDPSDPRVQEMARKWMSLVREFSGGDPGIEKSLENAYNEDPSMGGLTDPRMLEYMSYISKALAASK